MTTALAHSGATTHDSVVVAGRVDAGATVRLAVSSAADLSSPAWFGPVTADAAGCVKFAPTGLTPDHAYYAGFEINGTLDTARTARFRTHPASPGTACSFTVAASSCSPGSGQPPSTHPVFTKIKDRDPLLFMHLGDQNYANYQGTDLPTWRANIESEMTSSTTRPMYQSVPWLWLWDDHDFGADNSYSANPGKDAVASVYRQMIPHYPLVQSSGSIEHVFTIGRVRFILTDERFYRTDPTATDNASKTMLGTAQKAWFKAQVLAAQADPAVVLTVWLSSQPPHVGTAGMSNWGDFQTERAELWDFFATNDVADLIVWAGDVHASGFKRGVDYSASHGAPINVYVSSPLQQNPGTSIASAQWDGIVAPGSLGSSGHYGTLAVADHGTHADVTWRSYRVLANGGEALDMTDTFTVGQPPLGPGIYAVRDENGVRRPVIDADGAQRYMVHS